MAKAKTIPYNPVPLKETGSVEVSIENALKLTDSNGMIVGAIHCISPTIDGDENFTVSHSTILFYKNGYTHVCTGFEVGSINQNTSGFKWLVQTIPGVGCHVEGNYLVNLSTDSESNNTLKSGTSLHFIFRASSECKKSCRFLNERNKGVKAIEGSITVMAKDDYCKLLEAW